MAETAPSTEALTTEHMVSVQTDPRYQHFLGDLLLNPDKVLRLEGRREGIEIYMGAEQEAHLAAVLYARYLAVTSREWDILPASENPQDVDMAAFVKEVLLATNFDEGRQHLLKAIHRGFSVCELQWQVRDDGAMVLRQWVARPPYRFVFDTQEQLRVLTKAQPTRGEAVPQHKFQVFSWGDEYGTPYGAGLGSKTYFPVWFKREMVKFWLTFSDKFGMPTPLAQYPSGTSTEVIDRIQEVVSAIHSETAALLPNDVTVTMLESSRSDAAGVYEGAATYMDRLVTKLVQGQTLTTEQGSPGSLALGQVHMNVRQEITKADSDALAEALNGPGGVIQTLVNFNYPNVQQYPQYWVNFAQEDDLNARAERDERLVKSGVRIPERYFYEEYNLPRPEPGEDVVVAPAGGGGFGFAPPARFASPARQAQADSRQAGRLLDATAPFVQAVGDDLTAHILQWSEQGMGSLMLLQTALPTLTATLDMTALAEGLYPCVLESQLLGQAQIAGESVAFATVEDLPFAILDPEEAIAFFAEVLDLPESEWIRLLRGILGLTRNVAADQRSMITALVGDTVLTAIEEGSTLREFQDRIVALFKEELPGTSPGKAQLETVFRTNMNTAYQVGRYQQMTAMASVRPYWQYHAIDDSRVRPSHLAQHGKVYRADHPFWRRWYPPSGWNCRCTVVALAESELAEFGLTLQTQDAEEEPDEGFRTNVGELWTTRR